jgi:hypothetical protein
MALETRNLDLMYDVLMLEYSKFQAKTMDPNEDYGSCQKNFLKTVRYGLEPYVYSHLEQTYGQRLTEFWKSWTPPLRSAKAFILVERRTHPNFWFVLRNMAWAGPDMAVHIFCSDENVNFIKTCLGDKLQFIHLNVIFKGNPPTDDAILEYSDFYTNFTVYQFLASHGIEWILTVQMDVFFRKKLTDELFFTDFLGAPWSWIPDGGGCGGASVRRVQKMLEICLRFRPELGMRCPFPEDGWIDLKLKESGHVFPPLEKRVNLIMESYFAPDPFIIHQFWTFLSGAISNTSRETFLRENIYKYVTIAI